MIHLLLSIIIYVITRLWTSLFKVGNVISVTAGDIATENKKESIRRNKTKTQ